MSRAADRPPDAVSYCLRGAVLLQCLGLFIRARSGESAVFELLWMTWGLGESTALTLTWGAEVYVLAAGIVSLVVPSGILLYPVTGWFLLIAAAETTMGGSPFASLAVPAQALRVAAPLALLWVEHLDEEAIHLPSEPLATRLLQVALAATFATHGWEALRIHPRFVDYLIVAGDVFFGGRLAQSTATSLLYVIGGVDVLVALGVLIRRWRPLLLYMAFWGAVTALARIVHSGWWGVSDALVRAPHAGSPLAMYIWEKGARRRTSATEEG